LSASISRRQAFAKSATRISRPNQPVPWQFGRSMRPLRDPFVPPPIALRESPTLRLLR